MEDQTFLSQVKGFTPVIDVLAQEENPMTALVYGIVWRYCQLEDKVCRASKETIGRHAKISPKTVQRHLQTLVKAGYLEDLTPKVKHEPHTYRDTGKAQIIGLVEARIVGRSESPTSEIGGSERPTSQDTESHLGRSESPVKREVVKKEEEKKEDTPAQQAFSALADVCQYDLNTIDKEQRGKLNQAEKKMRAAGATPDLLTKFGQWWFKFDWRGKKGEAPEPHQVCEQWGRFRKWYDAQPQPQDADLTPREAPPDYVTEWHAAMADGLYAQFIPLRNAEATGRNNGAIVLEFASVTDMQWCQHRQSQIEDRAGFGVRFTLKGEAA